MEHGLHCGMAGSGAKWPAVQLEQRELPDTLVLPMPQLKHCVELMLRENRPAAHGVQGPPGTPVYPKEHRHDVTTLLPCTELLECAGHGVHAALAIGDGLYVPTSHGTQPAAPDPPYPALH